MVAGGDSFYYHASANLLVEWHGFIQPTDYFQEHWTVQAAEHPPLYILHLAIPSIVGLKSVLAHQLATCPARCGHGRVDGIRGPADRRAQNGPRRRVPGCCLPELLGQRRPGAFGDDGAADHRDRDPACVPLLGTDRASALWLGVGLGLVILSRAESVLLLVLVLVLVVVPLAVGMRSFSWRRRAGLVATCWVARPVGGVQPHPFRASGHHQHRARPNLEVVQLRRRLVQALQGLLGIVVYKGPPARGPGPVQPGACVPAGVHRLHQGHLADVPRGAAGS